MIMDEIKLYKAEFNQYTNYCYDTVSNYIDGQDISKTIYIHIPEGGLIIREDEFGYYKEFGHGFKKLEYIGSMLIKKGNK